MYLFTKRTNNGKAVIIMVITILEANVASDKVIRLESEYKQSINNLEEGILQTFLIRDSKYANLWKIITIWESSDALKKMRESTETPRGILIFRAAGAEPILSISEVVAHKAKIILSEAI
jgi:hypothetical protein